MEYLVKLKEYIDQNLTEILVKGNQLHDVAGVSKSKLDKDFRKQEGITLRDYIKKLKLKLAIRLKRENSSLNNLELMADVNYNYGERSFRDNLKLLVNEVLEDEEVLEYLLLCQNSEIFLEIFVRFILYYSLAEVEKDKGRLIIKHDVKYSNAFQFFQFFIPIESVHTYFIYLDIDTMKLSYIMVIQRLTDLDMGENEEEKCYRPNYINPYFNVLYNVEKTYESQIDHKLTDCIIEWDKYASVKSSMKSSFSDYECFNLEVDATNSVLKMNRNADFIHATNSIIDYFKTTLYSEFEEAFNGAFCFSLSEIKQYLQFVKDDNHKEMKRFINQYNNFSIKEIDFIIRVTSYPYLCDVEIYNYDYYIDDISILKDLKKITKNNLADLLIKFRVKYNNLVEYDDETTIEELLIDLLN